MFFKKNSLWRRRHFQATGSWCRSTGFLRQTGLFFLSGGSCSIHPLRALPILVPWHGWKCRAKPVPKWASIGAVGAWKSWLQDEKMKKIVFFTILF